ncbi:MAG: hypothetical protein ACFWT6_12455 [Virgibacillus proomii]
MILLLILTIVCAVMTIISWNNKNARNTYAVATIFMIIISTINFIIVEAN